MKGISPIKVQWSAWICMVAGIFFECQSHAGKVSCKSKEHVPKTDSRSHQENEDPKARKNNSKALHQMKAPVITPKRTSAQTSTACWRSPLSPRQPLLSGGVESISFRLVKPLESKTITNDNYGSCNFSRIFHIKSARAYSPESIKSLPHVWWLDSSSLFNDKQLMHPLWTGKNDQMLAQIWLFYTIMAVGGPLYTHLPLVPWSCLALLLYAGCLAKISYLRQDLDFTVVQIIKSRSL